jgi:hypothetical protein
MILLLGMNPVPYVSEKAQEVARWMERRLQEVSRDAGVIFISVKAVPALKGDSINFEVRLGIERRFEEGTGIALIKHVFEEQINGGILNIDAAVFRGVCGSASPVEKEEFN